jgi:hypothetical protein
VATTNHDLPQFDKTSYAVRVTTTITPVTKAAARLAAALSISSVQAMHAISDQRPIKDSISAIEVMRLNSLLIPLGFTIAVEPSFKWALTTQSR